MKLLTAILILLASQVMAQGVPPKFQELSHKSAQGVGKRGWIRLPECIYTVDRSEILERPSIGLDSTGVESDSVARWRAFLRRPITVGDLLDYERECWNDSTAEYYYTMMDGKDSWRVPCEKGQKLWGNYPCPEHWIHRQPTFQGFIEFMRKGMR